MPIFSAIKTAVRDLKLEIFFLLQNKPTFLEYPHQKGSIYGLKVLDLGIKAFRIK